MAAKYKLKTNKACEKRFKKTASGKYLAKQSGIKHLNSGMSRKVKRLGCSGIKDIIENNKLTINDTNTIIECSTFVAKGQSYEASEGNHDDLMMNLVMFGYFATTEMFKDMTDINIKEMMFKDRMAQIENDIVPFGFIDDGSDAISEWEQKEKDKDNPWAVEWGTTHF
jgi:ribosomal protein L35